MRLHMVALLLFALLALPNHASAQKGGAAGGKKAESQGDANKSPDTVPENWGALDDLKTGLEPRASVEVQHDEQPEFVRQLVRVQWREFDPIDLWIIRPRVAGKVPVVLYLYSYSDANDRFHDNGWCKRATADGFAAVGFVSALTDYRFKNRPLKQWFVSELAESLGTSAHDVQFILNHLADRGDMDMDHVGMFGMGSGATIAILAAHTDSRIKALDLLDPCGDCSLPDIAFLCPESSCAKNQRNGPCGGTRDGKCEVDDFECIWARAYDRLKHEGREEQLLAHTPVIQDQRLRGTSSWANTWLGRDHLAKKTSAPPPVPGQISHP
jgi:hypothetical protein